VQGQYYPSKVQGRNLAGTEQFRALFVPYPSVQFIFDSRHSMDEAYFRQHDHTMRSEGYERVCLDTFINGSGIKKYQATWVSTSKSSMHPIGAPFFNLTGYGWHFSRSYQLNLVPSRWFDAGLRLKPGQDLAWNYIEDKAAIVQWSIGNRNYTCGGPINFATRGWYEMGGVGMNEVVSDDNHMQAPNPGVPIKFRAPDTPVSIRVEIWYK
jgi:hypothetical protein